MVEMSSYRLTSFISSFIATSFAAEIIFGCVHCCSMSLCRILFQNSPDILCVFLSLWSRGHVCCECLVPSHRLSSVEDPYDYQGRSFLHAPQDLSVDLRSEEPPAKCFIPKKLLHTWCVGGGGEWVPVFVQSCIPDVLDIHLLLSVFTPCPPPIILPPSYFFSLLPPLPTPPSLSCLSCTLPSPTYPI